MKKSKSTISNKNIFRAIFVPVIILMICQAVVFFTVAVYGGVEQSLNQNAADIMSEKLTNRKNEIETNFNVNWTNFTTCQNSIESLYKSFQNEYNETPFVKNAKAEQKFLLDSSTALIKMLRTNNVNGAFLILNDKDKKTTIQSGKTDEKYGLCFFDMDQTSAYSNREDLQLKRCPTSIIENMNVSLDSSWTPLYKFNDEDDGKFFYNPINAAWDNVGAESDDLAYFCPTHRYSPTSQEIVSYSIPLIDEQNRPYAVLGVDISINYLATLLPTDEITSQDSSCYILTMNNNENEFSPIVSNGAFYIRCFNKSDKITVAEKESIGGFISYGKGEKKLYGNYVAIDIYNNNNPFENDKLTLVALAEYDTVFEYSIHIKLTLLWVSVLSLVFGFFGILIVSARFARPIKALANRASNNQSFSTEHNQELGHVGIYEIDQLVNSIETLNKNASKEIARTEFFSRMSHDMRTPMNAIISFSSKELLENASTQQKEEYLSKIHDSGTYLLGLINEVLDMTKIESNKVDLHNQEIYVDDLFTTVVSVAQEIARNKNIHFIKDLQSRDDLCVITDKQHINQIVMNLLSNALKFTPENGNVFLYVTYRIDDLSNDTVYCNIRVRDTGIGMSEEFLDKIYTPFEQESNGMGGTGLGLSICKKLVDLFDGDIECYSHKDEGTTFDVEIPLSIVKNPKKQAQNELTDENSYKEKNLNGKRILICEDHPLNTQIAKKLLERKGILVDTAANGKEGLELFENSETGYFDAILMDIRMPVMDGLDTTMAVRKLDREDAKIIPIIAMTANAFDEDIKKSRLAGMNDHLSKPINPEALYKSLSTFIK